MEQKNHWIYSSNMNTYTANIGIFGREEEKPRTWKLSNLLWHRKKYMGYKIDYTLSGSKEVFKKLQHLVKIL